MLHYKTDMSTFSYYTVIEKNSSYALLTPKTSFKAYHIAQVLLIIRNYIRVAIFEKKMSLCHVKMFKTYP